MSQAAACRHLATVRTTTRNSQSVFFVVGSQFLVGSINPGDLVRNRHTLFRLKIDQRVFVVADRKGYLRK